MDISLTQIIGELGAFGVVAAVLLLVIQWMLKRFTEEMRTHSILLAQINRSQLILTEMLISHDAQVRGINPSLDDEQDTRDREAVKVYRQLQERLRQQEMEWRQAIGALNKQ